MKPVSDKQKAKNKTWGEITDIKAAALKYYCEWCGAKGSRERKYMDTLYYLDGHHILPRARGGENTAENCCVLCRHCHTFVTDKNVDVGLYPTRDIYKKATRRSKNE